MTSNCLVLNHWCTGFSGLDSVSVWSIKLKGNEKITEKNNDLKTIEKSYYQ